MNRGLSEPQFLTPLREWFMAALSIAVVLRSAS